MLKREGIQFQICKNPYIKCSGIERVHRTIRDKLLKYFTFKSTHKFIGVLPKFVEGYNATVHGTTGMAPARVMDKDDLAIWNRMNEKRSRIPFAQPKFRVGQHVSISKEKTEFAKAGEENYTTEVIDGKFFEQELTPVRITERTTFKKDKILRTRVERG